MLRVQGFALLAVCALALTVSVQGQRNFCERWIVGQRDERLDVMARYLTSIGLAECANADQCADDPEFQALKKGPNPPGPPGCYVNVKAVSPVTIGLQPDITVEIGGVSINCAEVSVPASADPPSGRTGFGTLYNMDICDPNTEAYDLALAECQSFDWSVEGAGSANFPAYCSAIAEGIGLDRAQELAEEEFFATVCPPDADPATKPECFDRDYCCIPADVPCGTCSIYWNPAFQEERQAILSDPEFQNSNNQFLADQYLQFNVFTSEEAALIGANNFFTNRDGPNGNGVVVGDPHFVGFNGEKFEFHGEDGRVFNLFSEARHQLNALFTASPGSPDTPSKDWKQFANATWMSALGFRFGDGFSATLQLHFDGASLAQQRDAANVLRMPLPSDKAILKLAVNGEDYTAKLWSGDVLEFMATDDDDVRVHLPEREQGKDTVDGPVAVVTTPDLQVTMFVETEGVLHLDVSMMFLTQEIGAPEGVLGQTMKKQHHIGAQSEKHSDAFLVRDGLLGVDASSNKFGSQQAMIGSMRRTLSIESTTVAGSMARSL